MSLLGTKVGNLHKTYPDAFLREWRGCNDLDCISGCSLTKGHCERLAQAWREHLAQQSNGELPSDAN